MCQKCADTFAEVFPGKDNAFQHDILWNYTAFPAGSQKTICSQIREAAENLGAGMELNVDQEWVRKEASDG